MTLSHTAHGGRSSRTRANSRAVDASLARAFYSRHSAWGRIGDAMRAAVCDIAREGGFVIPQTTPGAAGATGETPGATHSSTSWHPRGPVGLRTAATPPAVFPIGPGVNS